MPGTAVFICDCAGQLTEPVDVDQLEALAAGLDGVSTVTRVSHLCEQGVLDSMTDALVAQGADRLLVAACSPRSSLKLPEQRLVAAAKRAGIEESFVEVANIREQGAWLHRDDPVAGAATARDTLRMAHARLQAAAEPPELCRPTRKALVIGAGPAGLSAARVLAAGQVPTVVVEQQRFLGGTLCQLRSLYQTDGWPSQCESTCIGPVQALDVLYDPTVTLHSGARVVEISPKKGNFQVRIDVDARPVDTDRCIACGKCEEVCPEETAAPFELGMTPSRKVIAKPFSRAVPDAVELLLDACTRCGACVEVCPTAAIDLDATDTQIEELVGAVVLATGTLPRELSDSAELACSPDVINALQLERLLARDLVRPSDGERPEHLVFVQCAGSRASAEKEGEGVAYCSKTCCAVTAKQAKRIAAAYPETEVSVVYYRDFRSYERALEKLHQDLRMMGVEFHNGDVTGVERTDEGLALTLNQLGTEELEDEGATETIDCDMVVLASASLSKLPAAVAGGLRLPVDTFGFPIENQPRIFRPTETFVDRVYAAGSAAGPKSVQQSVEQGATAALRAVEALTLGRKQSHKHANVIDPQRCSKCGVCVSVCPHGAIQMEEHSAVSDPAFCQACGMCAASCASHAASLSNFGDLQILQQAAVGFCDVPAGEPRVMALLCYWCSYGGADLAGVESLTLPVGARTMRIRCSSSVNMGLVMEMFRMGVDGVFVGGCPHNSCHHMWGNWLADKRTALMKTLLKQSGVDERRVAFDNIGIPHGARLAERLANLRQTLVKLGPNPYAASQSVVEGAVACQKPS